MNKKRVYFFLGTIAEFIKLAPIIKELQERKIKFKIIISGQSPVNFNELKDYLGPIKPDILLKEKFKKSSIILFFIWSIGALIEGIFSLRKEFKKLNKTNSYFIVHGDTVSSTIGSLIAKFYNLKLVHIESGLRSYNFLEPFPEEICRYINMSLADILFCPNEWALNNTKNFKGEKVNTKENTLIEPFWWAMNQTKKLNYKRKFGKYYILYIRRQEHLYFRKNYIGKIITTVFNTANKNLNCLFSLNPLNAFLFGILNSKKKKDYHLIPIERLPYADFMQLLNQAEFIATDGCTNQEEAYYMGLPLLALRNRTERIEGLKKNVIISKGNKNIIGNFLTKYKKYRNKTIMIKEKPSKIIVDYLFK